MPMPSLPPEADAVFEGGGVKGVAFAGAIAVAERAGIRDWKNVAGTSAGAIAACLFAVGYRSEELDRILPTKYRKFADYGRGGLPRVLVTAVWSRGLAPGRVFEQWLRDHLAESPLAKEKKLGAAELTFADLARDDIPDDVDEADRERARYRLRVIASDLTAGRMLVLPQDIVGLSRTKNGPPIEPDQLSVVEAVRMSMSFPYLGSRHHPREIQRLVFVATRTRASGRDAWLAAALFTTSASESCVSDRR